jgi:hypothetical protein
LKNIILILIIFLGLNEAYSHINFEKDTLEQEIINRLERVSEFNEVKKHAYDLGINKVYLFGGTASAFSHYVYWDLLRESGNSKYHKEKFDYDYTSIFRSNQDIDLVIDGNEEQAKKLEKLLKEAFPFFQGNKSVWEVRLLRKNMSDKDALLNNFNYLNQHSDSNSTGLIEITEFGINRILDLKNWINPSESQFLKDIYSRKLHYYFAEKHRETKRYKEGLNPPILSVIRYLTKAFQYELKVSGEDLNIIKKIISNFNIEKDMSSSYVTNWIEKNGKKLFQNAVNIEYAWNVLEELGLRKILIQISNSGKQESLAWWMKKEPLRSYNVGKGHGRTAKELSIDIVAHETNSFDAYESITKSHKGSPNVFISRENTLGEQAVYGNGFYTAKGNKGRKGTGLTIRFKVNPLAKEGYDFFVNGNVIIFENKKALEVITESYNLNLFDYFELLKDGFKFDVSDKAVKEKLKRKLRKDFYGYNKTDVDKIMKYLKSNIENVSMEYISEFFSFNFLNDNSEIIKSLIPRSKNDNILDKIIAEELIKSKVLTSNFDEISNLIRNAGEAVHISLAQSVLTNNNLKHRNLLIELFVDKANEWSLAELVEFVFDDPFFKADKELIEKIIKRGDENTFEQLLEYTLNKKKWSESTGIFLSLVSRGNYRTHFSLMELMAENNTWKVWEDLIEIITERFSEDTLLERLLHNILNHEKLKNRIDLIDKILIKGDRLVLNSASRLLLTNDFYKDHHQLWLNLSLSKGIKMSTSREQNFEILESLIKNVLIEQKWSSHPEIVEKIIDINFKDYLGREILDELIITKLFKKSFWSKHIKLINKIYSKNNTENKKLIIEKKLLDNKSYAPSASCKRLLNLV